MAVGESGEVALGKPPRSTSSAKGGIGVAFSTETASSDEADVRALVEVMSKVAPFLESPASSLRMSASTAQLAKGHDHIVWPEQLEFVKKLGSGAFADVELRKLRPVCEPEEEGDLVAVKQLKAKMIGNSLELKHFIAECAILRSLRHPNVVGCLGVGSLDSSSPEAELQTLYLVEEYVPGKTLRKLLLKEELSPWRTYSYGQAVDICADIASGLAYLHTLSPDKLVHRDIKPGNILLVARDKKGRIRNSSDGSHNHHHEDKPSKGGFQFHLPGHEKRHAIEYTAKIADFGLVKAIEMSRHGDDCAAQQQSGLICDLDESTHGGSSYEAHQGTGRTGSLLYMAPEVYAAPWDRNPQMYNEKVDIYSLALILHEVFNRQAREPPPYSLRNSILIPEECERLAANAANGERPRIPRHWPAELSELIQECWHQEPERRPNAADVARRLEAMKPFIIERMDKTGLYTWFS